MRAGSSHRSHSRYAMDTGHVSGGILLDVRFLQAVFCRIKVQHLFRHNGDGSVVHFDVVGLVFRHLVELEPLTLHDGKFPHRIGYCKRFEFFEVAAYGDNPVFLDRVLRASDADTSALASVVFAVSDDIAAGVVGGGVMLGHVFRPSLVHVGFHLVGIGQRDIAAPTAFPVEKGFVSEVEKLFGIGVDNGGTLYIGAAADTAYD